MRFEGEGVRWFFRELPDLETGVILDAADESLLSLGLQSYLLRRYDWTL